MGGSTTALIIKPKELNAFVAEIGSKVQKAFDLPDHRFLLCQKYAAPVEAATDSYRIFDTSSHAAKVIDLRGTERDAIKLISGQRETVFASLTFEWGRVGAKFRFLSAQFAIFSGSESSDTLQSEVRQLFRLEWEGRREDGSFEAAVAAHPHWQVDAIPSSPVPFPTSALTVELSELMIKREPVRKTWLTHIHLPCAANDWAVGSGWLGDATDCAAHTSSPQTLDSLSAWVTSASMYLRHQIAAAVSV